MIADEGVGTLFPQLLRSEMIAGPPTPNGTGKRNLILNGA